MNYLIEDRLNLPTLVSFASTSLYLLNVEIYSEPGSALAVHFTFFERSSTLELKQLMNFGDYHSQTVNV